MELTNELKEKLAACATAEEAKTILDAAGVALSDEQLDPVAGGQKRFPFADRTRQEDPVRTITFADGSSITLR